MSRSLARNQPELNRTESKPEPEPERCKTRKQVFRWHIGAVQLLLKDGVGFLCTSKMPTPLHKMFGLDSLTYYVQAVGGFFIILM